MTKQEIRKKYLALRGALSHEETLDFNHKLSNHFFSSVDLAPVTTIHSFLPLESRNEVNTWLILQRLRTDFPHVKISIPKVEGDRLINFYFENESQLEKNQWGILEPKSGELTPTKKIDLVIVPLLAFDTRGNRVGYGKGFYDKFLTECRKDCKKVGLSFFRPTEELIPIERFDMPLNLVITPEQAFTFGF